MSRAAIVADLIRTQARQLKMPGLARAFEDLARRPASRFVEEFVGSAGDRSAAGRTL